ASRAGQPWEQSSCEVAKSWLISPGRAAWRAYHRLRPGSGWGGRSGDLHASTPARLRHLGRCNSTARTGCSRPAPFGPWGGPATASVTRTRRDRSAAGRADPGDPARGLLRWQLPAISRRPIPRSGAVRHHETAPIDGGWGAAHACRGPAILARAITGVP